MARTHLTDIAVRNLTPPARGQITIWDDTLPAFGIRVSQGGTKSWLLVYGPNRQYITIGRYPIISLSDARGEAKRRLAEFTLGKHQPKSITFEDAFKLFIEAKEVRNRPRTVRDYKRLLKRHFNFGRIYLEDVTTDDVNRRLDALKDRPGEQRHAFAVARVFFRWALRRNHISRVPLGATIPTRSNPRQRVLSDRELATVYAAAKGHCYPFGPIVALCLLTGLRRSEVAALRWEYINGDLVTLPDSITKNRQPFTFPMGKLSKAALQKLPRASDYLFPASRGTWRRGRKTTVFNGWGKAKSSFDETLSEVAPWTLHDLRRTFYSNMAKLGVAREVCAKLVNHISGSAAISGISAVYNQHSYLDEMRDAVRRWEKHLSVVVRRGRRGLRPLGITKKNRRLVSRR